LALQAVAASSCLGVQGKAGTALADGGAHGVEFTGVADNLLYLPLATIE
jgi:hypothetical protein